MRFSIRHLTRYDYEPAAEGAALRIKLFPSKCASQRAESWSVNVNGEALTPLLTNGFGDQEAIWTSRAPQEALEIIAEGMVETMDTAGVVRGLSDLSRPGVFLRATELTEIEPNIKTLATKAKGKSTIETLHSLCGLVRERIDYKPKATHARTTASEALKGGKGVCQDHSHVFIAAARALDIPARYVVGYLAQEKEALHETHAWCEAFVPDLGWIGFDATNGQCPTEAYVRIAVGFDAMDAAPVRGCVGIGASERLTADVEIAQQQSQ